MSNCMGMDPIGVKKALKAPIKKPKTEFSSLMKRLDKAGEEADDLVKESKAQRCPISLRYLDRNYGFVVWSALGVASISGEIGLPNLLRRKAGAW